MWEARLAHCCSHIAQSSLLKTAKGKLARTVGIMPHSKVPTFNAHLNVWQHLGILYLKTCKVPADTSPSGTRYISSHHYDVFTSFTHHITISNTRFYSWIILHLWPLAPLTMDSVTTSNYMMAHIMMLCLSSRSPMPSTSNRLQVYSVSWSPWWLSLPLFLICKTSWLRTVSSGASMEQKVPFPLALLRMWG